MLRLISVDSGAVHDSRVLNESDFYAHPRNYFQDEKGYILGDSAYRLTNRVIKPFSKKEALDPNDRKTKFRFNSALSSARVKVEHTFGILKMRFPILRHLRMKLGDEASNQRVVDQIFALMVLHNFLLSHQDQWVPDEEGCMVLARDLEHTYNRLKESAWAGEIVKGSSAQTSELRDKSLGETKRQYLIQEVLGHDPRREREQCWWLHPDFMRHVHLLIHYQYDADIISLFEMARPLHTPCTKAWEFLDNHGL